MKYETLIIEKKELALLKNLMAMLNHGNDPSLRASVVKFQEELTHAQIMPFDKIPEDVIRINSFVTIVMPNNMEKEYQLVMPEKSNIAQNRISLTAPMGLALLGYAADDEIIWNFPSGANTIKITKVHQQPIPENTL